MSMQVNEAAAGMRKLTRESAPVKILKAPFQLAQVRAEIERFSDAKKIKLENRVMAFFHRNSKADLPLDIQIQALRMREEKLSSDWIDGVLTPLTEAETWEVRCEWGAIRKTLLERELEYDGEAKAAYHKEVEEASTSIYVSKWVGIALKQKDQVDNKWVRYSKLGTFGQIEPDALNYLFNFYHESFTLTDDDLKKFAAPTKAAA